MWRSVDKVVGMVDGGELMEEYRALIGLLYEQWRGREGL